jgi:hypothetical protein
VKTPVKEVTQAKLIVEKPNQPISNSPQQEVKQQPPKPAMKPDEPQVIHKYLT